MLTSPCRLLLDTFCTATTANQTEYTRKTHTPRKCEIHTHMELGSLALSHSPSRCVSISVETEDGDYMFCFDNSFSAVSEKIIFFELIMDNMEQEGEEPEDWKEYVYGTDMLDMKLEDIMVRGCAYITSRLHADSSPFS